MRSSSDAGRRQLVVVDRSADASSSRPRPRRSASRPTSCRSCHRKRRQPRPPITDFEVSPRVPGRRRSGVPAGSMRRSCGRCGSTRSILRYRTGRAGSRRCRYRTRSWSRARSARSSKCGSKAPDPLTASPLNLDDPNLLLSADCRHRPSNGQFHLADGLCGLQPDLRGVSPRARSRHRVGHAGAGDDGSLRLILRPFGFRGRNAGYSRDTGDLSFGYFNAASEPAGFIVRNGLICTSLSHDIIAHEITHALLDGLRSSFLHPTNVDVPAFHEGFADLVALFLHFTYPEVVEQAIRESRRGAITRGSLLTRSRARVRLRAFGRRARAPRSDPASTWTGSRRSIQTSPRRGTARRFVTIPRSSRISWGPSWFRRSSKRSPRS